LIIDPTLPQRRDPIIALDRLDRRRTRMLKIRRNTVRTATENDLDRFLRYPARKVVGVVDTSDDLEAALSALAAAGLAPESIQVFSGDDGIRCIDSDGYHHGLLGRLTRIFQAVGEEYEAHAPLRGGAPCRPLSRSGFGVR